MVWHELDEFTELQQKGTIGIKKYQLIYRVFFISRHFGRNTSSVIRQKGKFQNDGDKKEETNISFPLV